MAIGPLPIILSEYKQVTASGTAFATNTLVHGLKGHDGAGMAPRWVILIGNNATGDGAINTTSLVSTDGTNILWKASKASGVVDIYYG